METIVEMPKILEMFPIHLHPIPFRLFPSLSHFDTDARPHQSFLLRLRLWKQKVQQKRPSDALCGIESSWF